MTILPPARPPLPPSAPGRPRPLAAPALALPLLICVAAGSAGTQEPPPFRLQERLGRAWRGERLGFLLSEAELRSARGGKSLVDAAGKAVPYQIVPGGDRARPTLHLLTDLDPFQERSFRFSDAAASVSTDLRIEESPDVIRVFNGRAGVSVARALDGGAGPIRAIRLASGKWIGGSRLLDAPAVTAYRAEVTASGPVFAEVACRAEFGAGREWLLRLRVQAGEPVVLVEERFSAGGAAAFVLDTGPGFAPSGLLHRTGAGTVGRNTSWKIVREEREPAFVLEPWLHWWERERQGTWCGLYDEVGPDLLAFGAREPAAWVDPARPLAEQAPPRVLLSATGRGVSARFPLLSGERRWLLATLDRDASLAALRGTAPEAPLPQRYLIKHGDFPLDRVKDYVLDWPGADEAGRPPEGVFLRPAELDAYRKAFRMDPAALAGHLTSPLSHYSLDGPIGDYLGSRDPALGRRLAAQAEAWTRREVDRFLDQDDLSTMGTEPHRRANELLSTLNLAATVLGGPDATPEQRARLRAGIAFLGYTVARPDFHSPPRGFAANPNMTTSVAAFQARAAAAVPSHPMAAAWMRLAMQELKERELDGWSDARGGWLEAPHYATVSYDALLGCFLGAHAEGRSELVYDPKMKQVAAWLAKISTPPDGRAGGRRHLPPLGNTWRYAPSGVFGLVASVWKDRDPAFAGEMRWMDREQGSYPSPGIGGFYPTLAGFRSVLRSRVVPEKTPAWKSEWFPETGVLLRSGFPTARETQMHLIAGKNHAHYDDDSGSFTLWGKGRILADDFGYTGFAPADDHSRVVTTPADRSGVMRVREFAGASAMDYVRGERGGWTRQIAFIKDADPLRAHYFVLSDTLEAGTTGWWQMWLAARRVTLAPHGARVEGDEDVDLDVRFALPESPGLRLEEKSRSTTGLAADGVRVMNLTQTGLIAAPAPRYTVLLYPRLKSEAPPRLTALAGGKGLRIESPSGTDYVFLAPSRFTFREGAVAFEGTCGSIVARGGRTTLTLGAGGRISQGARVLKSAGPASR